MSEIRQFTPLSGVTCNSRQPPDFRLPPRKLSNIGILLLESKFSGHFIVAVLVMFQLQLFHHLLEGHFGEPCHFPDLFLVIVEAFLGFLRHGVVCRVWYGLCSRFTAEQVLHDGFHVLVLGTPLAWLLPLAHVVFRLVLGCLLLFPVPAYARGFFRHEEDQVRVASSGLDGTGGYVDVRKLADGSQRTRYLLRVLVGDVIPLNQLCRPFFRFCGSLFGFYLAIDTNPYHVRQKTLVGVLVLFRVVGGAFRQLQRILQVVYRHLPLVELDVVLEVGVEPVLIVA